MALVKSIKGKSPKWGENCYIAENATLVGDIKMGKDCSVWFNAVIRGDVNQIRIGSRVNIQPTLVAMFLWATMLWYTDAPFTIMYS